MCVIVLALFALHGQRFFRNSKDHAHVRRNSVENCREFYRRRETLWKGFDFTALLPVAKRVWTVSTRCEPRQTRISDATQRAVIALVVLNFDPKPVLAGWQIIRP